MQLLLSYTSIEFRPGRSGRSYPSETPPPEGSTPRIEEIHSDSEPSSSVPVTPLRTIPIDKTRQENLRYKRRVRRASDSESEDDSDEDDDPFDWNKKTQTNEVRPTPFELPPPTLAATATDADTVDDAWEEKHHMPTPHPPPPPPRSTTAVAEQKAWPPMPPPTRGLPPALAKKHDDLVKEWNFSAEQVWENIETLRMSSPFVCKAVAGAGRWLMERCNEIHDKSLERGQLWNGTGFDSTLFKSQFDKFQRDTVDFVDKHHTLVQLLHQKVVTDSVTPPTGKEMMPLSTFVALARLHFITVEVMMSPVRAARASQLMVLSTMPPSTITEYLSPVYHSRTPEERSLHIRRCDTFLGERFQLSRPGLDRNVSAMFHVTDEIVSELAQSVNGIACVSKGLTSLLPVAKDLSSTTGGGMERTLLSAWSEWCEIVQTFFAHLVVHQQQDKPLHVEWFSRIMFYVESQLKYLSRAHVVPTTVTVQEEERLFARVLDKVKRPSRAFVLRGFYTILNQVHLVSFLRDMYLFDRPFHGPGAQIEDICSHVFSSDYVNDTLLYPILRYKKLEVTCNELKSILTDKDSVGARDILCMYLCHTLFMDHRTFDWLKDAVILPCDWTTKHTRLLRRECGDEIFVRKQRPLVVCLLGRWGVWAYLPNETSPTFYDCGTAKCATAQWFQTVRTHFNNQTNDTLHIPPILNFTVDYDYDRSFLQPLVQSIKPST